MRMDLTIQQLRVIVAVHDCGGFTAAAQQLALVQSSVSRTVIEVERRLGVALFERTTRQLIPTTEGREFAAVARATLETVDANLSHFAGFLDGQRGRVRIATLPSLAAILLPAIVSAYRDEHPHVELSIEDCLASEVLSRVRTGAVDFAITVVSSPAEPLTDFIVTPVARDRFYCVLPPGHRLAVAGPMAWADLTGEPFISFDRSTSIRQHVDQCLTAAGARPQEMIDARNVAAVAGLVAAGLGVSVVPGLVLPLIGFANLDQRPLRAPVVQREIAVVRSQIRPLAPVATSFLHAIRNARTQQIPLPAQARWAR
jgi:LysR family transcriptional regulator, carnitine catabolism transcriptional activator